MKFCKICFEDKDEKEMFAVKICKHLFCTECIIRHVETKVMAENVCDVRCPAFGCKLGRIDFDGCQKIASKECMAKLNEILCKSLFLDPNQTFHCPYKTCSAMLLRDTDEDIIESECPECPRLFCAKCCVPWHSDLECHQFRKLGKGKGKGETTKEDLLFKELVEEKSWTKCPKCQYYIEKTQGCNHMKCR